MKGPQDRRFERLRKLAEPIARSRPPTPELCQAEDVSRLISEIQVYQAELEIQNEELRRSQNELQRSRDRFSMLFHMAPAGYLVLDEVGIIVEANRTILSMLQAERRDLVGNPLAPFIAAEDRPVFLGSFRAFYKNPASRVLDLRLTRQDGGAFHARLEGRFIPVSEAPTDQDAFRFCLVVTDVSESKAAEAALKKSEAEYRSLVTALNDAVVATDRDGRITFMNACAERLFGCPSREAVGTPVDRFCPQDRRAEQRKMLRQVRQDGSIPPTETERITVDGRRLSVEITISLRTDERGAPIGFNGVIRDVTERRRLDAALRRAERQLRLVVDSVPAQIWQKDRDGVFLQANRAYCRAVGRTEGQILGRTDAALFSAEIADQNTAADRRVLASGQAELGLEERYETASGEFGWSRKDKLPYHDDGGRIAGTIGFAVDITRLKEVERRLRESELRFRSFVESANDIVYSIGPDGRFTYVSPNWIDFMGEPAEAAVGRSFAPYVHPEDVHLCREFLERVLATGQKQSSVEYRVRRRDGSWRWHYSTGAPLKDDDGNVTGYLGIGRDITERKQAEQAMEESERYLRTILRTTADGFWEIDRDQRLVAVNDAYCAMSGYTREEILGMRISDLEADETSAETASRFQRILAEGSEIFETRHRRKDGSVFPIEVSVTWLDSKGGRMVCFCRDLTERKQAEATLKDERRRLASIIEGTNVGTWEWNVQTGETIFNERWAEIVGYTLEEIAPVSIDTWLRFLHPDDVPVSEDRLRQHFAGELAYYECEARMRHRDGHWVWVLDRGKVSVWTEDGKPLLMQGTHQDVSARKAAEEKLLHLRKAESLGRMAGAIAHHYNNLLGVVMGNLELAMEDCAAAGAPLAELQQAMTAARRASNMGGMMLAYLGQTIVDDERLDLSAVCRRLLPESAAEMPPTVSLESDLAEPGPVVQANADQFRQVLDNLLCNAREALGEEGGRVTVTLRTVSPQDIPASHRWPVEFHPKVAAYACLQVADDGGGIAEDAMARLFDPFYSTRFTGRGLGLSVVLGTAKAYDGCVAVQSAPGAGSVFRVFLPVSDSK